MLNSRMLTRMAAVSAFVLAGSATLAGAPVGMLPAAHAWCSQGVSKYFESNDVYGGVVAREESIAGTCNGDGTYRGTIDDRRADGACAYVKFRDAGVTSVQGIDCTANNGPTGYHFDDRNGDRRAEIKVCVDYNCDSAEWIETRGY